MVSRTEIIRQRRQIQRRIREIVAQRRLARQDQASADQPAE